MLLFFLDYNYINIEVDIEFLMNIIKNTFKDKIKIVFLRLIEWTKALKI